MKLDRSNFRDPHHYLAARMTEVAAPALRFGAHMLTGPTTPPRAWRNGVILGNGHIGDVLYRTCSLDALVAGLPDCRWSYITSKTGSATLANNPALDAILPLADDSDRLSRYSLAQARACGFDVALCSENVAHYRALLASVRLGVPNRVAFTRKGLSGLATIGVPLPEQVSHAQAFRTMVETVTGKRDDSPLRPRTFPSTADRAAAAAEFVRLGLDEGSLVLACSVTTRQSVGPCPPEFFEQILRRVLILAPSLQVVLTGVRSDRALLDAMAERLGGRATVSAGSLDILAFASMLGMCSAFLGTDSGSRHLSNAAGIPVFFVRNLGTTAAETGAYCPSETDIAPFGEYLSPAETRRALETVDHDQVARAIVAAASARANDMRRDKLPRTPLA